MYYPVTLDFFLFLKIVSVFSRTRTNSEILNILLAVTSLHARKIRGGSFSSTDSIVQHFLSFHTELCCQRHLEFMLPFSWGWLQLG